ncbi:MAG TPA: hypothetical protein HA236_03170 [Candidatus Nitrosotenuis sp.]|nr:hypothetical protein [Candidatus Nitrosotenuis sp.]
MNKLIPIKSLDHPLASYLKDDPVRPDIPHDARVGANSTVFALQTDDKLSAIVCVKYQDNIPSNLNELMVEPEQPTVAVFYTIWSYISGAGRDMILETRKYIEETNPNIKDFVTYSPKTEMAKRFHLKNGACTYRENEDSVNYKY